MVRALSVCEGRGVAAELLSCHPLILMAFFSGVYREW